LFGAVAEMPGARVWLVLFPVVWFEGRDSRERCGASPQEGLKRISRSSTAEGGETLRRLRQVSSLHLCREWSRMLGLTDSELDIVFAAARPLEVANRDAFLQAVASRLSSLPHLGDGLVFQICREVQREHWEPPVGLELTGPLPRKYGTL